MRNHLILLLLLVPLIPAASAQWTRHTLDDSLPGAPRM
jgi:hypothetical protein